MTKSCLDCVFLDKCKKVTGHMLANGLGCNLHEKVIDGVTAARFRVLLEFGPYPMIKNKKGSNEMKTRQRLLRSIAMKLGALEMCPETLTMPVDKLISAILGVTDDAGESLYPDIAEMEEEALREIVKAGKARSNKVHTSPPKEETVETVETVETAEDSTPPPKKRRKRRTATTKTEENAETTVDEPTTATTKRKPKPKLTSKRTKATATTSTDTPPWTTGVAEDIKAIGAQMVLTQEKTEDFQKEVKLELAAISERVDAIMGYLTWSHNENYDDNISSLLDFDWED